MKTILKKGTLVRESEVGHNNFHYPTDLGYELTCNVEAQKLSWVAPTEYYAYLTTNLTNNRVIWVEKDCINDYILCGNI
jgi:hypothetical protein